MLAATRFKALGDLFQAMAGWRDNDWFAGVMLALFFVTLGVVLLCLLLVVHILRRGKFVLRAETKINQMGLPVRRCVRRPGLPGRWLAIKCTNPLQVQTAFGLHKAMPCSWAEALAGAYQQKLFISPPVGGWILVFGPAIPDPSEDVDKCYLLILELSRKFGMVQYFSANPALHHHAWAQASNGEILRGYAWAGETLWNQGPLSQAEIDLRLKCFDYAEEPKFYRFAEPNPLALNAEKVRYLAARWSIDPAGIDPRTFRQTHGIAGRVS